MTTTFEPERYPLRLMLVSQMLQGNELEGRLKEDAADGSWAEWLRLSGVLRCSVFRDGRLLFVYAELAEACGDSAPEGRIWMPGWHTDLLERWPFGGSDGECYTARLIDVFHDDEPSHDVPWRREGYRPERRTGSLARLKPEMVASYIYYHYQLQEEKPRSFNKYYTIGSFGQYLFSYAEDPAVVETKRRGLLSTTNTPDDWMGMMIPHFELWPNDEADLIWRPLEELVSLEVGEA